MKKRKWKGLRRRADGDKKVTVHTFIGEEVIGENVCDVLSELRLKQAQEVKQTHLQTKLQVSLL